jgi:hypothetical protein
MKLAVPVALPAVLAVLVAGCGGGGTTTVIERTVTEKVEVPPSQVEKEGGGTTASSGESATREASNEKASQEAEEPKRVIHLQTFRTPSGNIGCAMFEGSARCDIKKRDWAPLPRPAKCPREVAYGQGLDMSRSGQAEFVCAGDTALDPSAAALSYGTASRVGGSECISRTDGVTCVNQSGHGFFISVQSYQVF